MEKTGMNSIRATHRQSVLSTDAHLHPPVTPSPKHVSQRESLPDKTDPGMDVLPSGSQTVNFPVGPCYQARVQLSGRDSGEEEAGEMPANSFVAVGQLLRPKSPTRQCSIPQGDGSHFSLALMGSQVGSEEGERIFHVQKHEMICAVASQTSFVDNEGQVVSSVDIDYYWCNFCTFSTATKTLLMEHVMEHRFHCLYCRYQSFSRSDVIHHSARSHPQFKDTAVSLRYCTMLSDYLRLACPKEGQPDQPRKRKRPPDDSCVGCEQSLRKVRRTGCGSARHKTQERYSADYVVFDVDVEDRGDGTQDPSKEMRLQETASKHSSPPPLEEVQEVENPLSKESICASSSSTVSTCSDLLQEGRPASETTKQSTPHHSFFDWADDQTAAQTSLESVCPPDLMPEAPPPDRLEPPVRCPSSGGLSTGSRLSTPSPPNLSSMSARPLPQGASEWVCAYCPFTSASLQGIKSHCKRHHRGKEFQYMSPLQADEHSAPPLVRYDDGAMSISAADEDSEMVCADQSAFPVSQMVAGAEEDTVENAPPDEPPVLVKQKPVKLDTTAVDTVEVHVPVPPFLAGSPSELKCLHCSYIFRLPHDLRYHISLCHKGKSLSGVDARNNMVYICPQTHCTFTSGSDEAFHSHTQACNEWPELNPVDFVQEVKQELEERVESVPAFAAGLVEQSNGSSSLATRQRKTDMNDFSCIHCNHAFVSQKEEMKRHVLDLHGTMLLVMRNIVCYRKRRKSYVYFCKWCSWEGEKKDIQKMHDLICKHKPKSAALCAERALSGLPCRPQDVTQEEGSVVFPSGRPQDVTHEEGSVVFPSGDGLPCRPQDVTHEEGSVVFPSGEAGAVCLQPQVDPAGEWSSADDAFWVPPVSSSGEKSTEVAVAVQDTPTAPHASTADQHKPDTSHVKLDENERETLSIPHLSAAADSLELGGQLEASWGAFDLISNPASMSVTQENMHQTLVIADVSVAQQDGISAYPFPHNADMTGDGTCPLGVVPDAKSSNNSVESSDTLADSNTRSNGFKTDTLPHIDTFNKSFKIDAMPFKKSFKTDSSSTCINFNAVTNRQHTDSIFSDGCSANVTEHPSGMGLEIPSAGNNTSQSCTDPPHGGSVEHGICLNPPDMNSSDSMTPGQFFPDDFLAGNHSSSSTDTAPLETDSDTITDMCAAVHMPDTTISTNSVYSSQLFADAEVSTNSASATLPPEKHSGSTDILLEEKAHASYTSATVDSPVSLESAQKAHILILDPETMATKYPCRLKRQKAAKGRTFHKTKRLKNTWNSAHPVMCSVCETKFDNMVSFKTHMLEQHRRIVAFPYRSPYHRSMHYKSRFFACPSLDCSVYNYSEAYVVSHYVRSHPSQPHPYTNPDYKPAPVMTRRKSAAKAKEPPELPSTAPVELGASPFATDPTEPADQLYMCLYCDHKFCTDTQWEMKAHYWASHAGQAITVRDVNAHRERRASRFYMCDQADCDFATYEQPVLHSHGEMCHSEQLLALNDRSYQCCLCGWITSEDASVPKHVSAMHQSEGGATVVTLAHGKEQQAMEERYIQCGPLITDMH